MPANEHNEKYLKTKRDKFGHQLSGLGESDEAEETGS
jgi:hypothetical protein